MRRRQFPHPPDELVARDRHRPEQRGRIEPEPSPLPFRQLPRRLSPRDGVAREQHLQAKQRCKGRTIKAIVAKVIRRTFTKCRSSGRNSLRSRPASRRASHPLANRWITTTAAPATFSAAASCSRCARSWSSRCRRRRPSMPRAMRWISVAARVSRLYRSRRSLHKCQDTVSGRHPPVTCSTCQKTDR